MPWMMVSVEPSVLPMKPPPVVPVMVIPGNHEVNGRGEQPVPAKVGRRGIPYLREAACVDLAGLRVIVGDTTIPGSGVGTLDRVGDDIVELAALGDFAEHDPFGLANELCPVGGFGGGGFERKC